MLIESLAMFFLVLSAYILRIYYETNKFFILIFFTFVAMLGTLVKVTSFFPLILLLSIILSWGTSFQFQRNSYIALGGCLTASLIPALLWTHYADNIKGGSELTAWLTSGNLRVWNFGTLAQRLNELDWISIFARYWLIGGMATLVILPILLIVALEKQAIWRVILLLILPFISPLTYFNLYVVHDYYFMAVIFPTILTLGYLLKLMQERLHATIRPVYVICVTLILLAPSWIFTIPFRDYKVFITSSRNNIPPLVEEIRQFTLPKDRILIVGCDWDPSVLFYADRYGVAVPNWIGSTNQALTFMEKSIFNDPPSYLAVCGTSIPPENTSRTSLIQVSENMWRLERK